MTGKLAHFAHPSGQFGLIGHEHGQSLLDGEVCVATRANKLLVVTCECGLALRVEGATELCEKCVVHEQPSGQAGSGSQPDREEKQKAPADCSAGA